MLGSVAVGNVNQIIKSPSFRFDNSDIDPNNIKTELIFMVRDNVFTPVWEVRYDGYVFHFDAE